jgi:hypothetical protein
MWVDSEVDEEWEEEEDTTGDGATLTGTLVATAVEAEYEVDEEDTVVELPDGLGTQRLFRERLRLGAGGAWT